MSMPRMLIQNGLRGAFPFLLPGTLVPRSRFDAAMQGVLEDKPEMGGGGEPFGQASWIMTGGFAPI